MLTRDAATRDWPQVWPLLQGMGTRDAEAVVRRRFDAVVADAQWLVVVAEIDGAVVGYAAAQDHGDHLRSGRRGRVARLHDLYVDPTVRRGGVGRALMAAVVGWAEGRVGYLQWQAHESDAAPFYERLGYHGEPCPQPDYPEFEIAFE